LVCIFKVEHMSRTTQNGVKTRPQLVSQASHPTQLDAIAAVVRLAFQDLGDRLCEKACNIVAADIQHRDISEQVQATIRENFGPRYNEFVYELANLACDALAANNTQDTGANTEDEEDEEDDK
jgi:hypothetical protein